VAFLSYLYVHALKKPSNGLGYSHLYPNLYRAPYVTRSRCSRSPKAAPTGPFCCRACLSATFRYKSVGFYLSTLRHKNPIMARFRAEEYFKAVTTGSTKAELVATTRMEYQVIADYVYAVVQFGTALQLAKGSTVAERPNVPPEDEVALRLYHDRIPGSIKDGEFDDWLGTVSSTRSNLQRFLDVDLHRVAGTVAEEAGTGTEMALRSWLQKWLDEGNSSPMYKLRTALCERLEKLRLSLPERDFSFVLWTRTVWDEKLQCSGTVEPSRRKESWEAYLDAVAAALRVAKHALPMGECRATTSVGPELSLGSLFTFLVSAKAVIHLDRVDPWTFRRVWVSESSLCGEQVVRSLSSSSKLQAKQRGRMALVRVSSIVAGKLLRKGLRAAMRLLGPEGPLSRAFAVFFDADKFSLKGSFENPSSKYQAGWYRQLQDGDCQHEACAGVYAVFSQSLNAESMAFMLRC
jgi:hypothetical protein